MYIFQKQRKAHIRADCLYKAIFQNIYFDITHLSKKNLPSGYIVDPIHMFII